MASPLPSICPLQAGIVGRDSPISLQERRGRSAVGCSFGMAVEDQQFWRREFEKPALLALSKAGRHPSPWMAMQWSPARLSPTTAQNVSVIGMSFASGYPKLHATYILWWTQVWASDLLSVSSGNRDATVCQHCAPGRFAAPCLLVPRQSSAVYRVAFRKPALFHILVSCVCSVAFGRCCALFFFGLESMRSPSFAIW